MATLSAWPWGNYGNLKYLLYAALAAQVVYSLAYQEDYSRAFWCLNILIICGLKGIVHVFWSSYNNMLFLTRTLRINPNGVDFKQIDHEWHWDNYILLQAIIASMICYMSTPSMIMNSTIPLWNTKGLIVLLVIHVTFSEPLYYFLHRSVHREPKRVPEFVFLAHGIDIMSAMHSPFVFRSFASMPYTTRLFLLPLWPVTLMVTLAMWVWSKTFLFTFYTLRNNLCQTWVVPRVGFHYFLPFAKQGINNHIEAAILRADKLGVKVISLAALNKNEALNGGGTLFVNKHPDLRVRVVHGNTLTAAVILNGVPKDVKEVFLTGATSKLGRAIALYLCRRGVRVLMLTLSAERFQNIQKEAPAEFQNYLVQVTKYNSAQHCKTWIVGKWLTPREQSWAPAGTHFHQFVVPPILKFRRNCTYDELAAVRLPKDVQGLGTCEYTMDRGVVHACHAGGLVHMLWGWEHHEVGAVDVERIDLVWEAAMRHGLSSLSSLTD